MFKVIKLCFFFFFFEKFISLQIQLGDLIERRKQREIKTLVQRLTGHY